MLEKNTTRKGQVDKVMFRLEFENDGNGKKYKIEAICDNAVYAMKSEGHLPGLYYLVS